MHKMLCQQVEENFSYVVLESPNKTNIQWKKKLKME